MLHSIKVLYIDDHFVSRKKFSEALTAEKYGTSFQLELCEHAEDFLHKLQVFKPDVVVLDIHLSSGDVNGMSLLQTVKASRPHAAIFMCSHLEDITTIRSCLELGADDYIAKSYDSGTLPLRLIKGWQLKKLQFPAREKPSGNTAFTGQTMQGLAGRIQTLVQSAVTAVHIQGESGTGKEVIASMIGTYERERPFVRMNCGALNPSLLESELFGHVKGAFTGADRDRKGFIQSAHGGWLFLDEIASLNASAQVALLRVLEAQELIPLGSHIPQKIQVRVISASNEPLADLVAAGRFRKDLWQRLVETEISLPPLRQRKTEIPDLVEFFCQTMTGGPYKMDPSAMKFLQSHDWAEGNVRELRNCLRAMTEFHVNKELTLLSLPQRILSREPTHREAAPNDTAEHTDFLKIDIPIHDSQPFHFEGLTERLLAECVKNLAKKHSKVSIRALADMLAMPKTTLGRKLKQLQQKNLMSGGLVDD